MRTNALAVANRFVEIAEDEGKPLHLLGLVKRVYIAHGFSLALLGRGLTDPRFDRVEAWKYGPVIPSVYHSFKQYRAGEIKGKTEIMEWGADGVPYFTTPEMADKEEMEVVRMVWKRYAPFTDSELVTLTHKRGTPWDICFIEGENADIPDILTEGYYRRVVESVASNKGIAWKSRN